MPDDRCSTPNPHASAAGMAVAALHEPKHLVFTVPGRPEIRWTFRTARIASALAILETPVFRRYDVCGGPTVPDILADELVPKLLDEIRIDHRSHVIVARSVVREGPVWEAIVAAAAMQRISVTVIDHWERSMLDRAAAPDAQSYLDKHLSTTTRKQLRRKRAALEQFAPLALEITSAPDALPDAFAAFCALERQGWKGRAGTSLAQDPAGEAYVRDLLLALSAEDAAFIARLLLGGRAIAAGLFLRVGGEVVFWKTTYDESLSKHSPGVVFDVMLTEWLYGQPWFERLDAGHDDSVDPDSLIWKQRRRMASVVIDLRPGSWQGRAMVAGLRLRQALRRWKNSRQAGK